MRSGYTVRYGNSRIAPSEPDQIWLPSKPRGVEKYGMVLLHGATANDQYASVEGQRWASTLIGPTLATAGIPSIAGFMGGDTFANSHSQTRVTLAADVLPDYAECSPDKVHLLGVSMGAGVGIRWAGENPDRVASFTGIIPMVNIDALYQGDILGLRSDIETAWVVTFPAALPASADLDQYADLMGAAEVPSRIYYSGVDEAIDPADVLDAADRIGVEAVDVDVNEFYGHNEGTVMEVGDLVNGGFSELIAFLIANGA